MQLPADAFRSDEGGNQPDSQRLPFLEVAELLESKGLPVPTIYVEDLGNGIILLNAIDLLADLHERCVDLPEGSIVSQRRFDRELLDWELDHFREWGLEALFGPLDAARAATLGDAFATIVREIETMPYGFVHRDYQSKNLMAGPTDALTVIDFQDALLGPRAYDLVALLCDSYVSLDFWHVALHRKLKDAGRFIYIDRVRKNPDFLQWYPQSLVYVGRATAQSPGLEGLERLLAATIPGFPNAVSKPASSME
jgi:aminoglycoside/choline kinase family phosphotransferase